MKDSGKLRLERKSARKRGLEMKDAGKLGLDSYILDIKVWRGKVPERDA